MSDPRRLLEEEDGKDLGRALLRSARADRPGPRARQRTLKALGVGGAIVGASATVSSASAAASASGLSLLKWIAGGVVSGLLVVGGASTLQQPASPPPPPVAAAAARVAARATVVAQAAQASPLTPPTPQGEGAEPPAPPAPGAAPPVAHAARSGAAKPSASALAEEVQLLDRARAALEGGDAASAIEALERRDQRFGGGALGPEARVIRIEALLARGDRARAAAEARSFLASHPDSPLASRVRSLLAAAGGGG